MDISRQRGKYPYFKSVDVLLKRIKQICYETQGCAQKSLTTKKRGAQLHAPLFLLRLKRLPKRGKPQSMRLASQLIWIAEDFIGDVGGQPSC